MRIQLVDLKRDSFQKKKLMLEAFGDFLDSSIFILGQSVEGFEKWAANFLDTPHFVSLANGSDAIQIALESIGLERGDNILTPPNAGGYAAVAARNLRVQVIPIEIGEESGLIDFDDFLSQINSNSKAVVVPHLFGNVSNLINLMAECKQRGLYLIEDCAQVFGGQVDGLRVGTQGDLATFSFYPTKPLGALGDGGGITTNNLNLATRIRSARQYGWFEKYHISETIGKNSRMDEIQARLLLIQKDFFMHEASQRRKVLCGLFGGAKYSNFSPVTKYSEGNMAHLNVIRFVNPVMRDYARGFLQKKEIQTAIHYPILDHKQLGLNNVVQRNLPRSERWAASILTLPLFASMSEEEIEYLKSSLLELDAALEGKTK